MNEAQNYYTNLLKKEANGTFENTPTHILPAPLNIWGTDQSIEQGSLPRYAPSGSPAPNLKRARGSHDEPFPSQEGRDERLES